VTLAALALGGACQPQPAAPPRASADRISSRAQLIGGPKALGEIGDYLLENDQIRVIVQAAGEGRCTMPFGGAIIDADLVRPSSSGGRGNDQLGEILPSYLLETMEPVSVGVTADGKDGGPAVVTVEGVGGDMLQMLAIVNTGLLYPPELRFREDYRLSPGARHVEIVSSITNTGASSHPLPYLDPSELVDLGVPLPEAASIELSVPMGHFLAFGAENPAWVPGRAGFDLRFAIDDAYRDIPGFPAFPGIVVEFLATRGRGVSYGFAVPAADENFAWTYRDLYGEDATDHSIVIPYLYSSVTGAYHAKPPAVLAPGETFTYRSYLIVGSGDVASVAETVQELHGVEVGTFAGRVTDAQSGAPVAHASIVVLDADGRYANQIDTDDNGGFRGTLPPGDYAYRVVTPSRPTTDPVPVRIEAGRIASERIELAPPATLALQVLDAQGRALPSKVTLVGRFPSEHRGEKPWTFLYDLGVGEKLRPTAHDPASDEYIEAMWYTHDGLLHETARPGTYDVVVSRGIEYDLHRETIELGAGTTVTRQIALRRVLDTRGYVSADFHLHAINSIDSDMALPERVISVAAEGVEYAVATDHNYVTDYSQAIASLGLERWLTSSVGLEMTTLEMGHFNGFPLEHDPGNVRGGEFAWVGKTPDGLFDEMRRLGERPEDVIIQANHPRDGVIGYFSQFNVDLETGEVAPREGLRALFAPFKPEFAPEAFSYDFDVYEVLNGKRQDIVHSHRGPDGQVVRGPDGRIAYPGQLEDWFMLLSRGLDYTGVGNSDSHKGLGQEPGYPRNLVWVGEGNDELGRFDGRAVIAGLRSRRVIMTNGPMIDFTIDGAPVGALVGGGAEVEAVLRVHSANFAPFDRVTVWVNGAVARELTVPADARHDYGARFTLPIDRDAFVVVEVNGDTSMFPVLPPQELEPIDVAAVIDALGASIDLTGITDTGPMAPDQTYTAKPLAITNPIWIDRDGNGRFDPPLPPLARKRTRAPSAPADVRTAFDAVKATP
jgi:hypothetical protein